MIQDLLKYQEVDAELKKIENELSGSEERKKAVSAKKYLDSVEENVNKLDDKAEELLKQYQALLDEQKVITSQKEEFETALKTIDNETSGAYLTKKVDELIGKIKQIAKDLNKLADDISNVAKEYTQIKSTTKTAQVQLAEFGKKYNDLKASKQEEREALEKKLTVLAKKVEPELMEKYLKKRAGKIYPIVYEVKTDVCGACNMQLSMLELNKLKNGEIIECDQCGRILYKKS